VTSDPRLVPLPAPATGVHLWELVLDPARDDAERARPNTEDRERLASLRPVDRARLLARRALARTAVAALAGARAEDVRMRTGSGPRRVEVLGGPWWWVSTASSGDRGLLALAPVPVGVDLEALPGPPDATQVSAALLAAPEHAWISAGGASTGTRFLATWVRKEAVVKCTGEGLRRDLRSFVVDAGSPAAPVLVASGRPVGIRTLGIDVEGHAAAVALAETDSAPAPW